MNRTIRKIAGAPIVLAAALLLLVPVGAGAVVDGIATGPAFEMTAKAGYVSIADGGSVYCWGFADTSAAGLASTLQDGNGNGGLMQYPGPTMIVNEGDAVTVALKNDLGVPVGIVFPGHEVTASGGNPGAMTREAPPDGTTAVTYSFTAGKPGTYTYYAANDLQVQMGLVGVIIVRPASGAGFAYNHDATKFDREYLFLITDMDPTIHELVEQGKMDQVDLSKYWPVYWFFNGRAAPDTLEPSYVGWLPHQPYNCLPQMHPGEKLLIRTVGGARDLHPFHHHGNHARIVAKDGRLLTSDPGNPSVGPDLAFSVFTIRSVPGETIDAIFEWTGKDMGWDIYGTAALGPEFAHNCIDLVNNETGVGPPDGYADAASDHPYEWCADHNTALKVTLPGLQDVVFGGFYSGSPYLGVAGSVPPEEGGLNPNSAFTYMWHSHTEKEIVNNDIFPGGMMTMLFIQAPGVPIP